MSNITIKKALITDAEQLTEIMKQTFDEEKKKWLSNHEGNIIDYNIQPPGYASIEMTKYMIRELKYFKILFKKVIVGGIIVTVSGRSYGRIDRIFIAPDYQGLGIGSRVINLIEEEFTNVGTWDLETSSRQTNNHFFYEKMGYKRCFESEEEYYYVKRKGINKNILSNQFEDCNMEKSEYYQVNLEASSYSNSNLMSSHINNCNLSYSRFQNLNFRNTLFADLNLSNSEMVFVTLGGVHFGDTNLGEGKLPILFERCELEGSKLINCNLRNVEIQESDVTGMKIDSIPVEELFKAYREVNKK
ncbi:MAG: GNAT family N-acetyltransferase [Anaerobacillus sp.]|uniref:GNAT family N-acetyltransferase n=1 Tax=Anaerobacillus sp. TaxID=1872506 RepID=UPI00391CD693